MASPLPAPRGPLSAEIIAALSEPPHPVGFVAAVADSDPLGDDLQLALHVCYELHYRGFAEVSDDWEWHPGLLARRGELERSFLTELRRHTSGSADVAATISALLPDSDVGEGLSHYLAGEADWEQMREFFVHRSIYHLKEADPHAWAIPRLSGRAKAAFVAVEFDEFGAGRADRMHATLFENLLRAADLDSAYLAYLDHVPAPALAGVNFMSLCGLHRRLRGALAGLFAAAEITTPGSARRTIAGLDRLGAPHDCRHFYREHVEADAVHEQVMRHEVLGGLLADDPDLAADIVFGVEASEWLERRFAERLIDSWRSGRSALRPTDQGRARRRWLASQSG